MGGAPTEKYHLEREYHLGFGYFGVLWVPHGLRRVLTVPQFTWKSAEKQHSARFGGQPGEYHLEREYHEKKPFRGNLLYEVLGGYYIYRYIYRYIYIKWEKEIIIRSLNIVFFD